MITMPTMGTSADVGTIWVDRITGTVIPPVQIRGQVAIDAGLLSGAVM
jgi:hypothetical protein